MTTLGPRTESDPPLLPVDLAVVLVVAAVSLILVVVPWEFSPVLPVVVGALVVFVTPGYALVAAMFPGGVGRWSPDEKHRLDGIERLVLGAGLSLATVGLMGLALGLTVGLDPLVVVGATSGFTVAATAAAVVRRHRLPPTERYRVGPTLAGVRSRVAIVRSQPLDRANLIVVIVAVSTLVAAAGIGYTMTQRPAGETFTEFALLSENAEGDLVADGYPTEFTRGESKPLVVMLENHERRTQPYTVVVVLEGEERDRIDEFSVGPLAAGETATVERQVEPSKTGESLRLSFLLYRGDAPSAPSVENAYREVHLRVDVTA